MAEKTDIEKLIETVLESASAARKAVLLAEKQILAAIKESPFSDAEVESLYVFSDMYLHAGGRSVITDCMNSPELVDKFTNDYNLTWK